ncbi:M56 family metallopeptidase [Sphingomonas hankyongi]|uniref:Peptidase M56 domain-containing protein n=1 Tax=Sphingomonas hankyongi TaxID=2908209 RepID=A0ABT0RYQ0_9SPHN|nr:M56 family metallopeptidase [Sphingomonas hankyongi]MCL6728739.1 hypothetical protein [Sphingomonas hankyongi]
MIDWLSDTLLATSLLMGFVLLIREPVRREFGPAVAYALWLVPTLRLLMPPLTWTVERAVSASLAPAATYSAPPSIAGPVVPSLVDQLGGWDVLALSTWLVGASAMLVCGAIVYRSQRRQVLRDSVQVACLGDIRIVRSAAVRGPMAFGILDRVIALPVDFDDRYEPQERRLAFDHELSHHRSGDVLINHLAFVLLCLQWFNPLAWLSHSAFRFDQEAACDARVLDKISRLNRATYAQAIAKAASGRALLFAAALDRPSTLQKRVRSMLTSPSSRRRAAGKTLIALTAATALPLTASWATLYVEVPAGAPPAAASKVLQTGMRVPNTPRALASAAAVTAVDDKSVRENQDGTVTLAGGVKLDKGSTAFFANDDVLINGKVKRLQELSPAERSQIRKAILDSQRELARERAELPKELAELRQEADRARSGELKRELMQDQEDRRRDLAEIDSVAAELRAHGEDPEKRKAEILSAIREAESIDVDKEIREAIEAADPDKIAAELRTAEEQMTRMLTTLDRLDRR